MQFPRRISYGTATQMESMMAARSSPVGAIKEEEEDEEAEEDEDSEAGRADGAGGGGGGAIARVRGITLMQGSRNPFE